MKEFTEAYRIWLNLVKNGIRPTAKEAVLLKKYFVVYTMENAK